MNKTLRLVKALFITLLAIAFHGSVAQNALKFDGVDDYVTTTFPGIMGGSTPITVEAWVRSYSGNGEQVITAWGSDVSPGNRFTFRLKDIGGTSDVLRVENKGGGLDGTVNVGDNNWHHIAVVYDPTSSNPYKLYVDGMLDTEGNIATPLNVQQSINLRIGRRIHATYTGYFDGEIDEVRVWDIARTATDLQGDMNSEFCSIPTNLVAYFRLNDGVAGGNNSGVNITSDDISNAVGTLNNFALSGNTSNWVVGSGITPGGPNYMQVTASACNEYVGPGGVIYTSSGVYLDTLQNVYGCDSVIETTLAVQQLDVTVTTSSTTLKANKTNATYRWLDCNDNYKLVVGGTQQSFTPSSATGSYAVQITSGGCTDTSACYSLDGVGIGEVNVQLLEVYPNPSEGNITVSHPNIHTGQITIMNATGQLIDRFEVPGGGETHIDLGDQAKGIYMIHLQLDNQTYLSRALVQ